MSNAIGQNATNSAVSGSSEDNFDWAAVVNRAASRKCQGMTMEKLAISRAALASAAMAEYRALFSSVYSKGDRLPENLAEKAYKEADKYIASKLGLVHANNVVSVQRKYHYKRNGMQFVERVIATGENLLRLEEQHLACNILLRDTKRRLDKLMASPTTTADKEQVLRDRINELEMTLLYIEGQQAKLKPVVPPEPVLPVVPVVPVVPENS